ncbi:MAG TPA: bifunctional 4-hydroxy-2-oxoglutarate aldolase/2-dehydro-3-deoxy-phosphogluconate aldolase [Symbiobacteriaceae bacterium]|nr:bifunctional 4-hydroxy-2-oxoglutarate aldolase/2-dehydro-3-deoxy-phosphogluconate aldolase [Symbiobacteriaceae bacterium]
MYRWQVLERITRDRLVAVIRAASTEQARQTAEALAAGGIGILEITMTVPGALECIRSLAREAEPDRVIGVGTVLDAETARLAILEGAQFVVSPMLSHEVIECCHRYGVPAIAGAYTPTEVTTALSWGADLVKVFPADTLGPGYFKALRAALPQAPLIPTGGVSEANARAWLEAGAVALGLGGSLTSGTQAEITARAARLRELVGTAQA